MTTALREQAGLAQAALWEVSRYFDEADSAAERRAVLEKLCAESEANAQKANAAVKASQDELGRVEAKLKAQARIVQDQRDRSAADLDAMIASAQGELNGLTARIGKARRELGEVDASSESLIKRLHLGA